MFCEEEATSNVKRGAAVPIPTEPVVTRELVYIVDAELMLETDTRELTVSVENVPGTALLIEETASVDRTRPLAIILDTVMVEPVMVEPNSVETVMVEPVSVERVIVNPLNVLPISVDTVAVGAVMVLPVRVDMVRLTAAELRRAR